MIASVRGEQRGTPRPGRRGPARVRPRHRGAGPHGAARRHRGVGSRTAGPTRARSARRDRPPGPPARGGRPGSARCPTTVTATGPGRDAGRPGRRRPPGSVRGCASVCDGDALVMPVDAWMLLARARERFPNLDRVSCYATASNVAGKADADLRRLREAGLSRLYIGPESGDPVTAKRIAKGATWDDHVEAARRAYAAGMVERSGGARGRHRSPRDGHESRLLRGAHADRGRRGPAATPRGDRSVRLAGSQALLGDQLAARPPAGAVSVVGEAKRGGGGSVGRSARGVGRPGWRSWPGAVHTMAGGGSLVTFPALLAAGLSPLGERDQHGGAGAGVSEPLGRVGERGGGHPSLRTLAALRLPPGGSAPPPGRVAVTEQPTRGDASRARSPGPRPARGYDEVRLSSP